MSYVKSETNFGDGRSVSLNDLQIPYPEKVFFFAWANGCYQPKRFLRQVADRHPEITDPEEIAKIASREYARQNFVFRAMVIATQKKTQRDLYSRMTQEWHAQTVPEHTEPDNVPSRLVQGEAKGMSYDPAFFICEKVAAALGTDEKPTPAQLKKYFRLIGILRREIASANNMVDLHRNFFAAVKKARQ